MTAEEHRLAGNRQFEASNYDAAVREYTLGIELDQRNSVLYNNRAAALMELKQYDRAAQDAERSYIIKETAKAHARCGRALHLLGGRTRDAIREYKRALSLEPANAKAREWQEAVDQLEGRSTAGSASSATSAPLDPKGRIPFQLNAGIVVAAFAHVLLLILSPALSVRAWWAALCCMALRMVYSVVQSGASDWRTFAFWKAFVMGATSSFAGQYTILCVTLFAVGAPPQQLLLAAITMYALVDLAGPLAAVTAQTLPGPINNLAQPQLDKVRANRDYLLVNAALCEAMTVLMAPLSGLNLIGVIVTWQFVKWRYRTDRFSKFAFGAVHEQLTKLCAHPRCPGVIGTGYQKLANFLRTVGSG